MDINIKKNICISYLEKNSMTTETKKNHFKLNKYVYTDIYDIYGCLKSPVPFFFAEK